MPEWEEWLTLGDGEFRHLQELCIINCPKLIRGSPKHLPSLKKLEIKGCQRIVIENLLELDDHAQMSPLCSLQELVIKNILDLERIGNLTSLQKLKIHNCPNLVSLAEGGLSAPSLTEITIKSCQKLRSLSDQMCTLLPSLEQLTMEDCPEIETIPEGGLPHSLSELFILDCKKLMSGRMEWGLQTLPSLKGLLITGESEEEEEDYSFPEECLLPPSLVILSISDRPNMKTLNPDGLRHLRSLQGLYIANCPKIESLPDEGLPTSLDSLVILECPTLKERCKREIGQDWLKIAHIPHLQIHGEII